VIKKRIFVTALVVVALLSVGLWLLFDVKENGESIPAYAPSLTDDEIAEEPTEANEPPLNDTPEEPANDSDDEPLYGLLDESDCDLDIEYIPEFIPIFTAEPLPEHIIEFITGVSFHDRAPFSYDFLTYLTITHVDFYGEYQIGHMIVADEIGEEVLEIFMEIFESRFPIYSIRLIDYFNALDYYSMAANNSVSFNFRYIAGTTVISRHGFGMAIDINPIQNPYIRGETIWPAAGVAYLDRDYVRPGMIVRGDAVYQAFVGRGWTWGGNWTSPRDYHHFERR